jgi:hypothetical protein
MTMSLEESEPPFHGIPEGIWPDQYIAYDVAANYIRLEINPIPFGRIILHPISRQPPSSTPGEATPHPPPISQHHSHPIR